MLIVGCAIVGWLIPEFIGALAKGRVPFGMNILGALAGALISASFTM